MTIETVLPQYCVCIGQIGWDDTVTPDGTRAVSPGGALLHFAAGWGLVGSHLKLVGPTHASLSRFLAILAAAGIDTSPLVEFGEMVYFEIHYDPDGRFLHDAFRMTGPLVSPSTELLAQWRGCHLHIATSPTNLVLETTRAAIQLEMPFTLQLHGVHLKENLTELLAAASQATATFCSMEEFLQAFSGKSFTEALVAYRRSGSAATWIVTTSRLVVILARGNVTEYVLERLNSVDPTGAGDAFAGAFMATWLETGRIDLAVRIAAAIAAAEVTDRSSNCLLRWLDHRYTQHAPLG